MALFHGGNLAEATERFGLPEQGWLDLSTGISPWMYPVPPLPDSVWHCLPYEPAHLLKAAADYYQCPAEFILPVAGSQDAIRRLPLCLAPARVALPKIGYGEHCLAWRQAGHHVLEYPTLAQLRQWVDRRQIDHVVVINPNNPSAGCVTQDYLLALRRAMADTGLRLVDEAFMDLDSTQSLATKLPVPGVIVLRSMGKFFGLAGMRLGFVLGTTPATEKLKQQVNPWGVNAAAIYIAEQALRDVQWQQHQRQRIFAQAQQLITAVNVWGEPHSQGLFVTLMGELNHLESLFLSAAQAGILLRFGVLDASQVQPQAWLRIGLPGDSWARFVEWQTIV